MYLKSDRIACFRVWNCLSEEVMNELTQFYQQFHHRIACRLPIPFDSNGMSEDFLNIDAIAESFADTNLSSINREKEIKRKKPRRKTGKKGIDTKDQALTTPLADASKLITNQPVTSFKEEGWLKVRKLIEYHFALMVFSFV